MKDIRAFKGIRYNPDKIGQLGTVLSPPYDVISPEQQLMYYDRSPHNIIRIILGRDDDGAPGRDKYERARYYFRTWLKEGVLRQDPQEAIYLYTERFRYADQEYTRTGFVSLLRLVEFYQGIAPHEKTMKGPIIDRMNLTKATGAQFGQIFSVYNDRERRVDNLLEPFRQGRPWADFTNDDGVNHRLWVVTDRDTIDRVAREMQQFEIIIADGHHRYLTALQYAKEHPDNPAARYTMMTFVNSFSEGMAIFPTNKVLYNLGPADSKAVVRRLEEYFTVSAMDSPNAMLDQLDQIPILLDKKKNLKNHVFGFYCNQTNQNYLLQLKNPDILGQIMRERSDVYKKLDVNIAHKIIIEDILGVDEEMQKEGDRIKFVKGNEETFRLLEDPRYQFGIFIRPPLMREIFLTAAAHETMPQKATYFYPKVWSGLVMRSLAPQTD